MSAVSERKDGVGELSGARPVLFCFSHLRWSFVWQRPQHLLSRAARDHDVFFFEEPVFERGATPHLDISLVAPHVCVLVPILPEGSTEREISDFQHDLIRDHLAPLQARAKMFWYYTPMAVAFTRGLQRDVTVYDNMDELSAFRGASAELLQLEIELFAQADVVFMGGRALYEAKKTRHPNVHCFPSSVDAAHFASARLKLEPDPESQQAIPHPRIGFFGVIDERMETGLIAELADIRPDWHFVMIGPLAKIDPEDLPRRANLHWLGMRTYNELPAYLARWDVGLMPFALNDSTRFISPTKTPEFLAAGLPVVSTPVPDVVRSYGDTGLVEIAADAKGIVHAAGPLLHHRRSGWLAAVDACLAESSWDATWQAMDSLLRELLGKAGLVRESDRAPAHAAVPSPA